MNHYDCNNLLESLGRLEPDQLHSMLLSNDACITIAEYELRCRYTFLNIVYMHHAFCFVHEDSGLCLHYIIQNTPICALISGWVDVHWYPIVSPFVASRKSHIESRIKSIDASLRMGIINQLSEIKKWLYPAAEISFFSGNQEHMSHYLWNHLGAFWRLRKLISLYDRSKLYVISDSQKYGFVDQLMELNNLETEIILDHKRDEVTAVMGCCIEPYSTGIISSNLQSQILKQAHSLSNSNRRVKRTNSLRILIALRTGGRSCLNYLEILRELFDEMEKQRQSGYVLEFIIYLSTKFNSAPFLDESIIMRYDQLREVFKEIGPPGLLDSCIFLLDNDFSSTISLLETCDFCISEWGASMALTRWILGLPSIVLGPRSLIDQLGQLSLANTDKVPAWGNYLIEAKGSTYRLCLADDCEQSTYSPVTRVFAIDYNVDLKSFRRELLYMLSLFR